MPSESTSRPKNKSTIGGNVTDVREENEEKWRVATNKVIVENLVEKIEELLDGKASYWIVSDRTTQHEKIVIEYNHKSK